MVPSTTPVAFLVVPDEGRGMRLTKFTHAAVRLEHRGTTIVIDPGTFSEPEVLAGAHAVLLTHEHYDHLDVARLRAADPDLEIWTNAGSAAHLTDLGDRVHVVAHGDRFQLGALDVHVYGERHAPTHLAPIGNVGFLIAGEVFYPGDALTLPEDPAPTLLTPVNAPWVTSPQVVAYLRELAPERAYATHDGLLHDRALPVVDAILGAAVTDPARQDYRRLAPGTSVDL